MKSNESYRYPNGYQNGENLADESDGFNQRDHSGYQDMIYQNVSDDNS